MSQLSDEVKEFLDKQNTKSAESVTVEQSVKIETKSRESNSQTVTEGNPSSQKLTKDSGVSVGSELRKAFDNSSEIDYESDYQGYGKIDSEDEYENERESSQQEQKELESNREKSQPTEIPPEVFEYGKVFVRSRTYFMPSKRNAEKLSKAKILLDSDTKRDTDDRKVSTIFDKKVNFLELLALILLFRIILSVTT